MIEEKLIEKVVSGNREAQKLLYEQFDAEMFRICYRYLQDRHDAEDVLMDAFYKVFQAVGKFEYRGPGSLGKWIRTIMINESLMFLRRRRKLSWTDTAETVQLHAPESADGAMIAEDIYEMVRQLPDGYRTVFNLYAIEGYSHKEIAGKLKIKEGTSKSQLSKARAILKKWITQLEKKNETESDRQIYPAAAGDR